jgi:ribonuclease HI
LDKNKKHIKRTRLNKASKAKILSFMEEQKVLTFDALLIGDGSGSNWKEAAGWGAMLIQHEPPDLFATAWYGAVNHGTVNFAEAMAYLAPLTWLQAYEREEREIKGGVRTLNVHIVTDSQYCRTVGSSSTPGKYANRIIWATLNNLRRYGMVITWHWQPRTEAPYNKYADDISRRLKNLVAAFSAADDVKARI